MPMGFTSEHSTAASRALNPRSVVIIGASADPRSFGGFVLGNLQRFGFAGDIHLVSRSSTNINGLPCVASIDELPEGIDVAVFAIPEAGMLDALEQCGRRKVGVGIVYASGYSETGETGRQKQEQLLAAANSAGMALLGPNCMGLTNFHLGLPLTFEALDPYPFPEGIQHGIAVVAQSGAMAANIRDAFIGKGLPITSIASTGNEASLGVEDFLSAYLQDEHTRVIAMYVEQIRRPQEFLKLCRQARYAGKPVVLMMPGRSARARAAAESHTGALAADHAVACTALKREAVLVVDSLDELFDTSAVLLRFPTPPAQGVAVMTGSGALKSIALDLADSVPLDLPQLSPDTIAKMTAILPAYAVPENPLDYTTIGMRDPGVIGRLMHTMLDDANVGSLMLGLMAGPEIAQRDKTDYVLPAIIKATKPCALVVLGDDLPLQPFFAQAIRQSGVPFFRSPDRAMKALGRVSEYGKALLAAERADAYVSLHPNEPSHSNGPKQKGVWTEFSSKAWLKSYGLNSPNGEMTGDVDTAISIAKLVGYPVVIKAQSTMLPHKSDAGAVLVGIANDAQLRDAWQLLHHNLALHRPDIERMGALDGILVEAMGSKGLELVIGAKRDAEWGPVILVGLGGIWIEALKDVCLLSPDLPKIDIIAAIESLKAASLFQGIRGAGAIDVGAVAEVVLIVAQQMKHHPEIIEIDLNPVVAGQSNHVDGRSVVALDALIVCANS
jgi:acetate---CoA ligase (ADP-forming)